MTRPRIGITTSYSDGEQRLDRRYVLAVERAAGLPVIVPMCESEALLVDILDTVDGIVVPGGPAITDGLIGSLPDDLPLAAPERILSDTFLLKAAFEVRKPVLGICYGMQLLNALTGGTIYGDVQAQVEGALTHSEKRGGATHPIALSPHSVISERLRTGLAVNTRHIQAVATVGPPLRATAHAPDGVIEAIESGDGMIVGVQFHPERMGEEGLPLFRHLVEQAASRK